MAICCWAGSIYAFPIWCPSSLPRGWRRRNMWAGHWISFIIISVMIWEWLKLPALLESTEPIYTAFLWSSWDSPPRTISRRSGWKRRRRCLGEPVCLSRRSLCPADSGRSPFLTGISGAAMAAPL